MSPFDRSVAEVEVHAPPRPRELDVVDRSAYVLGPIDGWPAVLLHGLTGSPWDLRPLAELLASHGYRVHAPLLAGHEDITTLASSRWTDWYDSARDALLDARDRRAPTLLVGFSMGSLLALRLAAEHPHELAGLVLLGVPIEHPRWQLAASELLANLCGWSPRLARLIGHRNKAESDVRSKAVVERRAALRALPYATIVEFGRLQAEARRALPRTGAPTLLLHGAYDHVADPEGSVRVSQALGSSDVRRIVLPSSFHHLVRDVEREQVCAAVLEFAERVHARFAGVEQRASA